MVDAVESDDPEYIARGLDVIARATGMQEFARAIGLSSEGLRRVLGREGAPDLTTMPRLRPRQAMPAAGRISF